MYYWRWREWSIGDLVKRDLYKLLLIAVFALGVFSLWFVLDPHPEAIWREFVLGENAGKFEARSSNYILDLLRGGDSIWMLALTTLANAGLFIFVLLSTLGQMWRERRFMSLEASQLLLLIFAFFLVFSLPSQRSGRYLLPVMPAFAALIALYWDRLPLWGFRLALLLQLLVLVVLCWIGGNLQLPQFLGNAGAWVYPLDHWALMAISLVLTLLGLLSRKRCKSLALAGCFLVYCALTSSLAPLEAALGRYKVETIEAVAGKDVWIPCDYRAKDEEYRLLLPGAQLHGYPSKDASNVSELLATYPLVAVQVPLGSEPVICEACVLVGKRMEMRARHSDSEIRAMIMGQVGEHLFVDEYLVSSPVRMGDLSTDKDACR